MPGNCESVLAAAGPHQDRHIELEPQPEPVGFAARMKARMAMAREGEDRAEGLAGENVAGSAAHPSLSSPDHAEAGDGSPSHRSLTGGASPRSGSEGKPAGHREVSEDGSADPAPGGR